MKSLTRKSFEREVKENLGAIPSCFSSKIFFPFLFEHLTQATKRFEFKTLKEANLCVAQVLFEP